jgi:hypothetical protein
LFSFNGYRQLQHKYDVEDIVLENQSAGGLIKDIKGFYIHLRTPYNSPIKTHAGYTVFPGIAIPFLPPLVKTATPGDPSEGCLSWNR